MLVTNDFPTPPFPETIAIIFRISRFPSRSMPGPIPVLGSVWVFVVLFWSCVLNSLSSALVIAVVSTVTVRTRPDFFNAFSTSDWSVLASGQWATVRAIFTFTWSPFMEMSRTMLRSMMLITIYGSRTLRRLSMTPCLSIKVFDEFLLEKEAWEGIYMLFLDEEMFSWLSTS